MPPLNPDDLNGKAAEVASLIFGIDVAGYPWMTLERVDFRVFKWIDYRIRLEWRDAWLSNRLAKKLAHSLTLGVRKKNRIKLFESGGLYFQAGSRLLRYLLDARSDRCRSMTTDLYQIELADINILFRWGQHHYCSRA